MTPEIEEAIWAGDLDTLDRIAGCVCCCDEHTSENCPARVWHGCRGQDAMTREEEKEWAAHYGMSDDEFHGYVNEG